MDDDKRSLYAYVKANQLKLLAVLLVLVDDAYVQELLSLVRDFRMMVVILNSYRLLLYSLTNALVEVVNVMVGVVVVGVVGVVVEDESDEN